MQERALIFYISEYASIGPLLAVFIVGGYLLTLFLIGYAELHFLKSRGAAAATWLLGIGVLSIVMARRAAWSQVSLGIGIFLCGVAAMVVFMRRRGHL